MKTIVLEINSLTFRSESFTAVDVLSLSVNSYDVVGLLGSNGARKIPTIKLLTSVKLVAN